MVVSIIHQVKVEMKYAIKKILYVFIELSCKLFYNILKIIKFKVKLPNTMSAYAFLSNIKDHKGDSKSEFETTNVHDFIYDLTVIIPAYNVENYICECIDSVLNQVTKYSIYIKVINDGSTDSTRKHISKYENNDNVEIIDLANGGVSRARNCGLLNIKSLYVSFLDGDDQFEEGAIDKLLNYAYAEDADIVEGSYVMFERNKILKNFKHDFKIIEKGLQPGDLYGYPWGKVFRSNLFFNNYFECGYIFEDTLNTFIIYPLAKKILTCDDIVYRYRRNKQGIMHLSRCSDDIVDTYWITERLVNKIYDENIEVDYDYLYAALLRQYITNHDRLKYMSSKLKKSVFVLERELAKKVILDVNEVNENYQVINDLLMSNDYYHFVLYLNAKKYKKQT